MRQTLSIVLLLGCAAFANAQDSQPTSQPTSKPSGKLQLAVSASAPKTLIFGEDFVVKVRVENKGSQPVAVRPILVSSHSAYVELSGRRYKKAYGLLRFPGGIEALKPAAQTQLGPGEVIEGTLTFPTVETGSFDFRVGYTGHIPYPLARGVPVTPFFSAKLSCDVKPSPEGGVRYQVFMKTNHGDVRVSLDDEVAPCTVRNFVALVRKGFYKGLGFSAVGEIFGEAGIDHVKMIRG